LHGKISDGQINFTWPFMIISDCQCSSQVWGKKLKPSAQVKVLGHKEQHSKFTIHVYSVNEHPARCTMVAVTKMATQI
jgi:hypothetical protein